MRPEQYNNCVKIGTMLIPAVNIQVENVPGYLVDVDGEKRWYGVYFEILFETGALWIVEQGSDDQDREDYIIVTEYPKWGMLKSMAPKGAQIGLSDWGEFIGLYNEKRLLSLI